MIKNQLEDELNSVDCRLTNLVQRLTYEKWFRNIIKYEKLEKDIKQNLTTSEYSEQFYKFSDVTKEKILSNWECGYKPVIQTSWIERRLDIKEIEKFLKNNSKNIEKDFNIFVLRLKTSLNSIEGCFLGKKTTRYQFIMGKIQETQPTYYIYFRYSLTSNIIQFRTSENIGRFKEFLLNGLKRNYRDCKLGLTKVHIMSLATEAFARNAKIQCEGEEIHERGYAVPENKNLFSIVEFINTIKKKNYIIRKIFVTLNLKKLKSPYNQVFLRIFPNQGKFSFTGLVNEEQIRETLNIIQKIRSSKPTQRRYKLMDQFFNSN